MKHRSKALRAPLGGTLERPRFVHEHARWQFASSEECDKYKEQRRLRNLPPREPAVKLPRWFGEPF